MDWLVYILKCSDNTLYTGATNNIKKRVRDHNKGKGSAFTRGRLPVKLIVVSKKMEKGEALSFEAKVKKLKRNKKIGFVLASHLLFLDFD